VSIAKSRSFAIDGDAAAETDKGWNRQQLHAQAMASPGRRECDDVFLPYDFMSPPWMPYSLPPEYLLARKRPVTLPVSLTRDESLWRLIIKSTTVGTQIIPSVDRNDLKA
jgi:hypothetical protein